MQTRDNSSHPIRIENPELLTPESEQSDLLGNRWQSNPNFLPFLDALGRTHGILLSKQICRGSGLGEPTENAFCTLKTKDLPMAILLPGKN